MYRGSAGGGGRARRGRRLVGAGLLAALVLGLVPGYGLATCSLDDDPCSAPASSPNIAAGAQDPGHSDADDCCPLGCTDCAHPCCQLSVSAFLLPGHLFAADMRAEPAALPSLARHLSFRSSGLDRPPRA